MAEKLMKYADAVKKFDPVIGLETHVELSTTTKLFCPAEVHFGGEPNTQLTPVSLGLPGSLPVVNKTAVDYAIKLGLALHCEIAEWSQFARKNYFYPDMPRDYQISQYDKPTNGNGYLDVELEDGTIFRVPIERAHIEDDAGKNTHVGGADGRIEGADHSLVDYNRAGVPLIEIVSEPDMRSADEVIAYLEKLRLIIQYLGASDCKLQEGSMRADVNLSVREVGAPEFGTRTEMKNLNSFKAIARAIEGERVRQIELIEEGKAVVQETRRWDDNKEYSYAMRSKEDAKDYRYFPDPDLPPVHISDEWIDRIVKSMPEFQPEKQARYVEQYGLPQYDAGILTGSKKLSDLFEETTALCGKPKKVANWLMGETLRLLKENGQEPEDLQFSPKHLASLIELAEAGSVNNQVAKEVFEQIFAEDVDPEAYVEEHGLKTVNDTGLLEETTRKVLENNPGPVEQYKSGKTKVLGFLVGQVMKEMKGKANPAAAGELLQKLLSE